MAATGFQDTPEGLRYAEHISVPMRLFAGVLGAAMFIIPVPFVMHANASTPWHHLLLAALCVIAPCLMGLLFLAIACGRTLRLEFDSAQGVLRRRSRSPLRWHTESIGYHRIAPPDILERSSEDGPYYVLRVQVQGERPMQMSSFDDRAEAQRWCARLHAALGR